MAFDAPDYYNRYAQREEHEGKDNILLQDDFSETPMFWEFGGVGAPARARTFDYARSGEASLNMTASNNANDTVYVRRLLGLPYSTVLSFECWFSFDISVANANFYAILDYRAGTVRRQGGIRYNKNTTQWEYYDTTPAWTAIPNSVQIIYNDPGCFNYLKCVIDIGNAEMVYMRCNDMLLDLSSLAIYTAVIAASGYYVNHEYLLTNVTGGANIDVYLDDIIIAEA